MKTTFIKAVVLANLLFLTSISLAELVWMDKIIAKVEEDVILDSELKRRVETVKQQLRSKNTPLPPEDEMEKQVLERLIMDQIQIQMASRAGIRISDAELNDALKRIADSTKATIEQMKAQLESEGISFALFREDIRNELLISRVRQGTVSRRIFVSDQEIDDILKIMEERGASTVEYHLKHLMLKISESAGPDDVDKVRARLDVIVKRFEAGENFTQLVIAKSEGSNALKGGDLGWRTIDQLPGLFGDSINNLEKGQITSPIRSANGLHLLMLEDTKGGIDKQIVDELHYRHILLKISTVTSDERAEAKLISIRKEILAGDADFAEQAKVESEDLSTASLGGDLGWAPPMAFNSLYGDNADQLQKGELSQPFKGAAGWYLVEKLGSRSTDQTEEIKRERARRILQGRKFEEEQETWLREIREQAYVEIIDKKNG